MSVISVVAKMRIQDGKMDEAMEAIKQLAVGVGTEDGCLLYTVNTVKDDPNKLVSMERYQDKEALGAHGQSAHFQEFFAKAAGLLDGQPEMEIMREVVSK